MDKKDDLSMSLCMTQDNLDEVYRGYIDQHLTVIKKCLNNIGFAIEDIGHVMEVINNMNKKEL